MNTRLTEKEKQFLISKCKDSWSGFCDECYQPIANDLENFGHEKSCSQYTKSGKIQQYYKDFLKGILK